MSTFPEVRHTRREGMISRLTHPLLESPVVADIGSDWPTAIPGLLHSGAKPYPNIALFSHGYHFLG